MVLACQSPLDVQGPMFMEPGAAQDSAAAWVSACTGRDVSARDVRWFIVESIKHDAHNLGGWDPPNLVYLVRLALNDVKVSAHELLHHVLRGDPGHKNPAWATCGVMP